MEHTNSPVLWIEKNEIHAKAAELIRATSVVLDIGCGIRPQQFIHPDILICVEPYQEYVDHLKLALAGANAIIIQSDAYSAASAFPDRSVDSVFLIDVIEHVPKPSGRALLQECERIARDQIIVFTPLGFAEQMPDEGGRDAWNLSGGAWQMHRSGWYPEDFPGWTVLACKDLHTHGAAAIPLFDVGPPITVPFGGFYAIKTIKVAPDLFNPVYAEAILRSCPDEMQRLEALFPQLIARNAGREVARMTLKRATQACQTMTELFMEKGASERPEKILEMVQARRSAADLEDARSFVAQIKQIAMEFVVAGGQKQLAQRAAELEARDEQIRAREAELTALHRTVQLEREQFATQEVQLKAREAQLAAREEQVMERERALAERNEESVWRRWRR